MGFAELEDARLYYRKRGRGAPLILVSGLGASLGVWDSVVPALSEVFSVIRLDNRGIGRSVAKRKPRTLRDYACDIRGLLDHLGYERAHIIGSSLGGMIAQQFAMDFPDRTDRLVLLATCHRFSPYLRQIMTTLTVLLRRGKGNEYRDALTTLGFSPAFIDANPDVHDQVREAMQAPVSRLAVATQFRALVASEFEEDRYVIPAETLVVGGSLDVLIPFRYVEQLAAAIERSELIHIEGVGHALLEEAPEIVIPAIVSFLRDGPGGPKNNGMGKKERRKLGVTHR